MGCLKIRNMICFDYLTTMRTNERKHLGFILLGQCSFTLDVLQECLKVGIVPDFIGIENDDSYNDHFIDFQDCFNHDRWWKEHMYYHYSWKQELKNLCQKHRITCSIANNVIKYLPRKDILVVAGYGKKISNEIIARFHPWALNVHPSLLPEYKGAHPEAKIILNNEKRSGVSIHGLTENFDSGPIFFQQPFGLSFTDNVFSLEKKEARIAANGLKILLKKLLSMRMNHEKCAIYDQ